MSDELHDWSPKHYCKRCGIYKGNTSSDRRRWHCDDGKGIVVGISHLIDDDAMANQENGT
jgi:hypothetical protein